VSHIRRLPRGCSSHFSGELNVLVANMVRQYPLDPYYGGCDSLPDFAALAMAYIVLILKLLFGIDGSTEKFVSSLINLF
jgi:hypothetical protein